MVARRTRSDSRSAEVLRLLKANKSVTQIGVALQMSHAGVYYNIAKLKQRGEWSPDMAPDAAAEAAAAQEAKWPAARADKVRRLFASTVVYIAEAVGADDVGELFETPLKDLVAPQAGVDLGALLRRLAGPVAADVLPPPDEPEEEEPAVFGPSGFEPSRDDDEAELAALEDGDDAEPEEPPAPTAVEPSRIVQRPVSPSAARQPATGNLWRLSKGDGHYLHESLDGLTTNLRFAWKGTTKQLETVLKARPALKDLDPERVPG